MGSEKSQVTPCTSLSNSPPKLCLTLHCLCIQYRGQEQSSMHKVVLAAQGRHSLFDINRKAQRLLQILHMQKSTLVIWGVCTVTGGLCINLKTYYYYYANLIFTTYCLLLLLIIYYLLTITVVYCVTLTAGLDNLLSEINTLIKSTYLISSYRLK